MAKPFRRGLFNRVALRVGEPLAAGEVAPETLRSQVAAMLKVPA
jgi:hypothetical protein